jgi:hypothetical protein
MFIWKNWNIDKDLETKLEKEKETINQMIKESINDNSVNTLSTNFLNSSLIDNYQQIVIKYISKDVQTDKNICEKCENLKKLEIVFDEINEQNKELQCKIIEMEQKIKELIKDKDKQIEMLIHLQIENDKIQTENNYKGEKITLLEKSNYKLKKENEEIKEKLNIHIENVNNEQIKNKELIFEIEKKINDINSVKSENKRLESENFYLVNKINDFKSQELTYYENEYNYEHNYNSKKKVQTHIGGMDTHTNDNKDNIYNKYLEMENKYNDVLLKVKEMKIKNDELNKKVRDYEIKNMVQFNRAIRSRIPIAFHALHTDISNLN